MFLAESIQAKAKKIQQNHNQISKTHIKVNLYLKSPWAADVLCEQQFHRMQLQLSELFIDERSSILLLLMALFEPTMDNMIKGQCLFRPNVFKAYFTKPKSQN